MHISTLSQQLNMSVKELRQKMRDAGFRISERAQKIDNVMAREVMRKFSNEGKHDNTKDSVKPATKEVFVPEFIIVKDFAAILELPVTVVIKKLIENGVMVTINEEIDFDTAAIVGEELGFIVMQDESQKSGKMGMSGLRDLLGQEQQHDQRPRPPIVAVMGHVDHGKTTLLDTIRKTEVAAGEAGAITQHIGAYQVEHQGKKITFLDTPGHEAFAAMRARGANVTDIIVLVVGADDSVKPQTVEVINRAKLTKTPMIIVLNKIDKADANPEKVKADLSELGVTVEEWGGTVPAVPVSAKKGQGIEQLLEIVLLTADMQELVANPDGNPLGVVIESHLSRGQGALATVLVENGTLRINDPVVVGSTYGRIRTMIDASGKKLRFAHPSTPVVISGLSHVPEVGDILRVAETPDKAKQEAVLLQRQDRAKKLQAKRRLKTEQGKRELNLIIRGDVQGSVEAIIDELTKFNSEDVRVNIVDSGAGEVSESDVLMAENTGSTIVAFHTRILPAAVKLAKRKNILIDQYDIIYELFEDVTQALLEMMPVEVIEEQLGRIKIKAVFMTEKRAMIVGGEVVEGKAVDKKKFRIIRNKSLIGEGKIDELQHNKAEVDQVEAGQELGIRALTEIKIEKGDILEVYNETVRKKEF